VPFSDGHFFRGLYIGKYPPGGKFQLMSFGGKNMKNWKDKEGKCKKGRKEKEKGRRGKKKEKGGSLMVK
jgi:hypothetical protein